MFLWYFVVDNDGNKRPIPAPRRLVRMPAANSEWAGATNSGAVQSSESENGKEREKSGKEVALGFQGFHISAFIFSVRGFHVSLSTDSQGRDLLLIPPGSNGFSTQRKSSSHEMVNDISTLPQYQKAEGAWNRAGPKFQQSQTRFRSYNNTFDAGVVLPSFIGPGPFCADRHIATNLNDPDIGDVDNDIIMLLTVALAIVDSTGSSKLESNSTILFPSNEGLGTRKTHLLSGSTENGEGIRSELTANNANNSPAKSRRFTGSHLSTLIRS